MIAFLSIFKMHNTQSTDIRTFISIQMTEYDVVVIALVAFTLALALCIYCAYSAKHNTKESTKECFMCFLPYNYNCRFTGGRKQRRRHKRISRRHCSKVTQSRFLRRSCRDLPQKAPVSQPAHKAPKGHKRPLVLPQNCQKAPKGSGLAPKGSRSCSKGPQ